MTDQTMTAAARELADYEAAEQTRADALEALADLRSSLTEAERNTRASVTETVNPRRALFAKHDAEEIIRLAGVVRDAMESLR